MFLLNSLSVLNELPNKKDLIAVNVLSFAGCAFALLYP